MNCPRCASPIHVRSEAGELAGDPYRTPGVPTSSSTCAKCGGTFVSAAEFPDLVRRLAGEHPAGEAVAATWGVGAEHLSNVAAQLLIRCPSCQAAMQKCRNRDAKLVLYDQCGQCGGVWFDRDELERITAMLLKLRNKN